MRQLGSHRERAVAAVAVADGDDLVGIDVRAHDELQDQAFEQWVEVVGVEAVPLVGRSTQRAVPVTARFRVVLVVDLHVLPLAVVELLRHAAAAVHRDHEAEAVLAAIADLLLGEGTLLVASAHAVLGKVLAQLCMRRATHRIERELAQSRVAVLRAQLRVEVAIELKRSARRFVCRKEAIELRRQRRVGGILCGILR